MYCVAIDLWAKPGCEADVEGLFRDYAPVVEALPGTIRFEVHRDVADSSHFLLYELYKSREALLTHRGDDLFKVWRPRIAPWKRAEPSSNTIRLSLGADRSHASSL